MQNKKPSVLFFFILVFTFSIPFWILGIIYPVQLLPGLPISAFFAVTPALAALILKYKYQHLSGVLQLLQRSFDVKRVKNKSWLLLILLINPAIAVLAYQVINSVSGPIPGPAPLTLGLIPMAAFFFIGALGEEIGWSGYATEPLQQYGGTLLAGLMLGSVWAAWHILPLLQAHRSVGWIAWWSLNTISLRMIMTWLFIHFGKSVFVAAAFHAMINLSWQLFPVNGSFYDPQVFGLIALSGVIILYSIQKFLSRGQPG